MSKSLQYAETRLVDRGWWLGTVSIVDVYLDWAISVVRRTDFDLSRFRKLDEIGARLVDGLPAYRRMQEEEVRSRDELALP